MAPMAAQKRALISDGPLHNLLRAFEKELEVLLHRVPNSDATALAQGWMVEYRRALTAARQEDVLVSVTDLAARQEPKPKRSVRTMRRRCADGHVRGAHRRGREWFVGRDGAEDLLT